MEWQPIETAPRDGKPVIGWLPGLRKAREMRFVESKRKGDAWHTSNDAFPAIGEDAPTHWMPLPEPPK